LHAAPYLPEIAVYYTMSSKSASVESMSVVDLDIDYDPDTVIK
jgi:hypothetical protein